MHFSAFQITSIALAIVCAGVQAFILRVLWKRKLSSQFPIFASYTAFSIAVVIIGLTGYLISSQGSGYFYMYWILSFLFMALEFGVMYEILANALKPYSALIDLGRLLFFWASMFLLIAATLTGLATMGPNTDKLNAGIGLLEHSMRLMQCGLLLLFFLLERRLGLSWKSPSISVALGLGVTAAMDLSTSYLKAHFAAAQCPLSIINTVSYLGVLCFWSYCLALPQPERKTVLDSPSKLIFQRWNEALLASPFSGTPNMALATPDPFLPGVEKTVDRILSRKMVS